MEKERLAYLITAYLDHNIKSTEEHELMRYIGNGDLQDLRDLMDHSWATKENLLILDEHKANEIYASILRSPAAENRDSKIGVFKLNSWWRSVAAVVALVALGTALFVYENDPKQDLLIVASKNDIAPGKQGATLTLANGKKINLADAANGELVNEAGLKIKKAKDGQLVYEVNSALSNENVVNTLSTANGETYIVQLPDGSRVWLNSASSLTYTAKLNQEGKRKVKLDGEAYFEINKDKLHPFIVESRGQQIEVLGTHFNVNTYKDEPLITTTLLEGSVRVTAVASGKAQTQVIKPGEQALNNAGNISTGRADLEKTMDWKNGDFFLNHVDFKTAMRKIARWYNVEVIYDSSVPNDIESGGWLSRDKSLITVLNSIQASGLAKFKIDGRKIYVSR
ncbi:FecR domain-containing protein [Pedobacter sp. MC2016-14]|uniref:FecR family protein n=1 Tax=Pedobacter sp. MC2016-14 TaxID=2897327 RepID=UPI001E576A52|nr:FecR family protein [Pedobacter sp. MC2016-14]MCD0489175.1 FecR domain-containing protein [Pedobacter sp. MC2016-14]